MSSELTQVANAIRSVGASAGPVTTGVASVRQRASRLAGGIPRGAPSAGAAIGALERAVAQLNAAAEQLATFSQRAEGFAQRLVMGDSPQSLALARAREDAENAYVGSDGATARASRAEDASPPALVDDVGDLHQQGGLGDGPLNLPINQFPGNEEIRTFMDRVTPLPGYFDVGLHGRPDSVEIALSDGRVVYSDHRLLSELVAKAPDYHGGPIRLISCSTGAHEDGLAQNLANKIGQNVMAPSDTVWIWPDGNLGVGRSSDCLDGTWKLFLPGGSQ